MRVLMLEHAIYSVISPEGCASILWRSADQAQDAAEALRLTAAGSAAARASSTGSWPSRSAARIAPRKRRSPQLGEAVDEALRPLLALDGSTLRLQRREKFLAMGGAGL